MQARVGKEEQAGESSGARFTFVRRGTASASQIAIVCDVSCGVGAVWIAKLHSILRHRRDGKIKAQSNAPVTGANPNTSSCILASAVARSRLFLRSRSRSTDLFRRKFCPYTSVAVWVTGTD
ncbi:Protein argonaute 5 [Fusarium oxysporum f. sp. albedinis]|nr:Protein argonaute 5 [Fusarium oxysporum f. sp. albedinis]